MYVYIPRAYNALYNSDSYEVERVKNLKKTVEKTLNSLRIRSTYE